MLSVDAFKGVPVGVRPPPPLRGSSPCEAGQFWHLHDNKTAIMAAAWSTEGALCLHITKIPRRTAVVTAPAGE